MGLDALLGDCLGDALGLAALKLARQQVAQPALQQRHDAAQEEQPHAPHGRPEAHARPLAHRARVEPVVYQVLQVLKNFRNGMLTTIGCISKFATYTGMLATMLHLKVCKQGSHHAQNPIPDKGATKRTVSGAS